MKIKEKLNMDRRAFIKNGAITRAQYDKSLGDLRDLMEMQGVE